MSDGRSRAVVGRIVALTLVAAGGTALAVASIPTVDPTEPQTFSVEPPAPVVACPGQQSVPVGDVGSGGDLASAPTIRTIDVYSPGTQRVTGEGTAMDAIVGAQVERIADGDIAGWAALTCSAPAAEQWLVGGSTALGSSARLVLTNPSTAPSEVTVTLYGPLGRVEDTFVVPVAAGSQTDRLIESIAASQSSLVVHVAATGPGVAAALQDSRLDGFQPAGTSWVGPSVAGERLVIPGVGLDGNDATVTLRLMAPEGARVDAMLVSQRGVEPWSTGSGITLEPGVVSDLAVPVSALGAIEVTSDAPVFAAARTVMTRVADEGLEGDVAADATWVPAVALSPDVQMAVVPAADARIAAYSPYTTTVNVADSDGNIITTGSVGARTIQWVDLDAPAGTVVTIDGDVAWSLVMTSDTGFVTSVMPMRPADNALEATVVPRPYAPPP